MTQYKFVILSTFVNDFESFYSRFSLILSSASLNYSKKLFDSRFADFMFWLWQARLYVTVTKAKRLSVNLKALYIHYYVL